MATIEPRLMHLLNDSKTPDLPPIQLFPFKPSSNDSLSLPPIETEQRAENPSSKQIPPFYTIADETSARQPCRADGAYSKEGSSRTNKSSHPLQLLLEDPDFNGSSHSLRMILDDAPEIADDASRKKRHRAMTVKDDFVQLPQPLKKQKSNQQVVPPIINGLHEPPPDAAVFPPIASGSFDDTEAPNLGILKEFNNVGEDRAVSTAELESDKTNIEKIKRRAAKPRRKWSEEETNHLLLGVSRHGVGKWTTILEDPDFRFNNRTAGDLKDRFRTCCPAELRGQSGPRSAKAKADTSGTEYVPEPRSKPKKGLLLEGILIDTEELVEKEKPLPAQQDSDSPSKPRKSRAHRKKMEDLVELGIHGPFKKSHRRERRPFTEQDDKEILEGLDKYGPAWTKIQRDPQFNLSTRQPTDLRDRVRNKYPKIYLRIDKGSLQVKDTGRGDLLEPSVNTTIGNSLNPSTSNPLEPHLNRTSSKEDMPKWPLPLSLVESSESIPGISALDMHAEPSASVFMLTAGEMDISRLLLDDSRGPTSDYNKHGALEYSLNTSPANGAPELHHLRPARRLGSHNRTGRRPLT